MRIKINEINNIWPILYVITALYIFEASFFRNEVSASIRISIVLLLTLAIIIYRFETLKLPVGLLFFFSIIIGIMSLGWLTNGVVPEFDFYTVIMWCIVLCTVTICSYDLFADTYILFMAIIGYFSTIMFVLEKIQPSVLSFLPVFENWHGENDFRFAILGMSDITSNNLRNYGIFYEPGMHGVFQNIALYFILFLKGKNKDINLIMLAGVLLGVISSLSTSAYMSVIILFVAYFLSNGHINENRKLRQKTRYRILLVTLCGFLIVILYMLKNPRALNFLISKFSELGNRDINSTEKGSGYERLRSLIYAAQLSIVNPIFGCGTRNFQLKFDDIIATFTPLNWICLYGFTGGILLNVAFVIGAIRQRGNIVIKLLLVIFMLTLIMTQNLTNDFVVLCLVLFNVKNMYVNRTTVYEKKD